MSKIPYPIERMILQHLVDSEHEVMIPFQSALKEWKESKKMDSLNALVSDWVDDLQEIYDKAERVDEIENNLYQIDNLIDDAENSLSEIRGYTNV
tara:strand:+ start:1107 stop:1391 length:285 start_codon:yes stop_codon:yes gene_type:complete